MSWTGGQQTRMLPARVYSGPARVHSGLARVCSSPATSLGEADAAYASQPKACIHLRTDFTWG